MLAIDIKNIFEDLYGSYQLSIYLDMNHIVSLVNIDDKKINEESAAIFKHISSRIEGSFNLIISNPYEDILHSSVCYQTLLDNKNFRFLYGRQVTGKGMEGSMLKQFQDLETVEDYITWCDELISYYFEKVTERNLCINGEYMLRISSYIMEHIEEDVSLGKLSSIFHISTGHLSRSF